MHDLRLERLTFFSDAVFAIAMTLLVIELRVPHVDGWSDAAFLDALWLMTPSFVGFVTSFLVIGLFWANHHRAFAFAGRWLPRLAWANLFLLLAIVFLPFASAFMSDYFGARVPHLLYAGTMLVAGLLQRRLLGIVLAPANRAVDADPAQVTAVLRRAWAVPAGAALAMLVAFVAPGLSVTALVLILPLIRLLHGRVSAI